MSNDLVKGSGGAVVPMKLGQLAAAGGAASAMDENYASLAKTRVPTISMSQGAFYLTDAHGAKALIGEGHLDVVLGAVKKTGNRQWWAKAINNDEPSTPPDCFSRDGVTPDASMVPPMVEATGAPARSCAECPKQVDGSHPSGRGKACGWKQHIIVYSPTDIGGTPMLLKLGSLSLTDKKPNTTVPPRALKPYVGFLRANGIGPGQLVTRMTPNRDHTVTAYNFQPATDEHGNSLGLSDAAQKKLMASFNSPEVLQIFESAAAQHEGGGAEDAAKPAVGSIPPLAAKAPPPPPPAVVVASAPARPAPVARPMATDDSIVAAALKDSSLDANERAWLTDAQVATAEKIDWIKEVMPQLIPSAPAPTPAPTPAPVAATPTPPKRPPGRPRKAVEESASTNVSPAVQAAMGFDEDDI